MYSHYKFYKSVPIDIYVKGSKIVDENLWELGVWEYRVDRPQWGLMHYHEPTHMSYGLDYAKPKEALKRIESETDWYFDVGSKLTVKKEDLEKAFKELGIWESE